MLDMLDVTKIRKQFPILTQAGISQPLVYLDNAATTQKPMVVLERVQKFYSHENANIHRGIYQLAYNATEQYEGTRTKVANFLNAPSQGEIVFCGGTTEAINAIAQGLRHQLTVDDEILVSAMEHHANFVPWQTVCKQTGATFRVASLHQDGSLDMGALKKMINPRTKILAITHISNTLGTINPVEEIVAMAHKHHAIVVVDGAQSVAYQQVDVDAIDCDFFVFSGHKIFAPMGAGVLYGKMEHLEKLFPFQQGGAMILNVAEEESKFKPPPHGLEAGTPPVAEVIALGTALDFVKSIGLEQIQKHSHSTLQYAKNCLESIQGLTQKGPKHGISNIQSFVMDHIHPHDIATILGEQGVAVRAGHHCSQPLMNALGVNSTVRVSFSIYNDKDDVDKLVEAITTVKNIMA